MNPVFGSVPAVAAAYRSASAKTVIAVIGVLLLLASAAPTRAQDPGALPVVAVMDLEAVGASKVEAVAVTERLREVLLKTGRFTLADRGQIETVLNEQALQQTGCTSQECAVQVGRILGVRRLVTGKIVKVGHDLWLVSAQMIDVETAETLAAESLRHQGGLFDILDGLMPKLGARLAGTAPSGGDGNAVVPVAAAANQPPAPPPEASGASVALFPALLSGDFATNLEQNNPKVVDVLVKELGKAGLKVAYSFYPTDDPAPYDAFKRHALFGDVGERTWSGFFSKDPDAAFILSAARSLGVDEVLFYRTRVDRGGGSNPRTFALSLWDVKTGRKLEREGHFEPQKWGPAMVRAMRSILAERASTGPQR